MEWNEHVFTMATHARASVAVVTADEVDPANLGIRTWVDGELRQDGSTKEMVTGIGEMIAALSGVCTLVPGDLIATGTPRADRVFSGRLLRPGQRVRAEVQSIRAIENPVVVEPSRISQQSGLKSARGARTDHDCQLAGMSRVGLAGSVDGCQR